MYIRLSIEHSCRYTTTTRCFGRCKQRKRACSACQPAACCVPDLPHYRWDSSPPRTLSSHDSSLPLSLIWYGINVRVNLAVSLRVFESHCFQLLCRCAARCILALDVLVCAMAHSSSYFVLPLSLLKSSCPDSHQRIILKW